MSENIYYCSNCGGVMEFDVKTQSLKCPNCDTQVNIVNDKKKIITDIESNLNVLLNDELVQKYNAIRN